MVEIGLGAAVGFVLGAGVVYFTAVLPALRDIRNMRYDGFRPSLPPQKPKTVPILKYQKVRED